MRWFKSESKKNDRERYVNVIYFIDASQTRTIKISVARAKLVFAALALWILCFLLSSYFNVYLWQERLALESRIKTSLATIFRYEVQYDGVYEHAYGETKKSIVIDTPELHDNKSTSTKEDQEPEVDTEDAVGASEIAGLEESQKLAVTVAKPVVEVSRDKLDLRFDLISSMASGKAQGFVYGVAEFKTDSGEKLLIVAPEAVATRANGEGANLKKAVSFAIRRFKQQNLSFSFDPAKTGFFTNVQIHVLTPDTSVVNTYNVPVQIRIGKSPSNHETQAETSG